MAIRKSSRRSHLSNHPRIEAVWLTLIARTANLVLLSVPIGAAAAGLTTGWMFANAQTPLDWLITEGCAALTLIGVLCSWSLLAIRPAEPEGLELTPVDAPELFAMVKRRGTHFRIRRLNKIVLGDQPEIRLDPKPRSGYPLPARYTLYLGWPLLCCLDTNQFRLALRSAVGQWSTRLGGGSTVFLCHQAAFWSALRAHCGRRRGPAGWLLGKPIVLFADYFEGRTTEIRRSQAFVHDRIGQSQSDDTQLISVLTTQAVAKAYLEARFWPWVLGAATRTPEPLVKPFTNFFSITEQMLTQEDANRWILQAMGAVPDLRTASLRERLAALGHTGTQWDGFPVQSAATAVFGQRWPALAARLDDRWRQQVRAEWRDSHEQFQRESREYYALKVKAKCESVVGSEALRYLRLAEKFVKPEERVALFKTVLRDNRIWPDVCFQCGRLLLAAGDAAGIRALEQAMQLDQSYVNQASALIATFEQNTRVVPFQRPALAAAG